MPYLPSAAFISPARKRRENRGTPSPLQPAGPGDAVEIAAPSGKPLFNRLIRLVYNILRFSLDRHNRLTYLSDPMEM